MTKLSPHVLWKQANGDRDEYLRLMQEHGHLVPGKRRPGKDIFGHELVAKPRSSKELQNSQTEEG